MSNSDCANQCNSIAKCDIFDFMAKHVGMTVIHPGGFKATRQLLRYLKIDSDSKVIDIACGKGTTTILIAEQYGCHVVGVDFDEGLIEEAKLLTRKKGLEDKITYYVADAMQLPFNDDEFDIAISQAMLVLVDNKLKAIQEAKRVIKSGGTAGWLELSWKKEPEEDFLIKISSVICAYCMRNVSTFEGWKNIFKDAGIDKLNVVPIHFNPNSGLIDMISNEGVKGTFSMMLNILKNNEIRERMRTMRRFFREYEYIFGSGIYYFNK